MSRRPLPKETDGLEHATISRRSLISAVVNATRVRESFTLERYTWWISFTARIYTREWNCQGSHRFTSEMQSCWNGSRSLVLFPGFKAFFVRALLKLRHRSFSQRVHLLQLRRAAKKAKILVLYFVFIDSIKNSFFLFRVSVSFNGVPLNTTMVVKRFPRDHRGYFQFIFLFVNYF